MRWNFALWQIMMVKVGVFFRYCVINARHVNSSQDGKKSEFKRPTILHLIQFFCLSACSIFLVINECNNLECSLHWNISKKHDYVVFWLKNYQLYISSFSYSYCILTDGRYFKRKEKLKLKNKSDVKISKKKTLILKVFFMRGVGIKQG